MADRLRIYACSGIGETDRAKSSYDYWLDNTKTVTNTQAVNTLFSLINMRYAELTHLQLSQADMVAALDEIDLYSVCLYYAQQYAGNTAELQKAGKAIGVALAKGLFRYNSVDNDDRDKHLDQLFDQVAQIMRGTVDVKPSAEWNEWWQRNVLDRDKVGLTSKQISTINSELNKAIKGIGDVDEAWMQNKDLAQYLTKGSEYFLYLYFTDAQLAKLPKTFKQKATQQRKTYEYCKALFVDVYGSEEEMQNIIYTGIVGYFNATPEDVCKEIASGKRKVTGVGFVFLGLTGAAAVSAFMQLLTALVTLVVGVITAICSMAAQTQVARYAAVDAAAVESSVPDASDYDGISLDSASTKSYLWIGAAVAALLLFFRR